MFDFEDGSEDGDASEYCLPWERVEGKSKCRHGRYRVYMGKQVVESGLEQRGGLRDRIRS